MVKACGSGSLQTSGPAPQQRLKGGLTFVILARVGESWPDQLLASERPAVRRKDIGECLRHAFPLPTSGSFDDLLQTLAETDRRPDPQGPAQRK